MFLKFQNPQQNEIAIFDDISLRELYYILKDKKFTVIEVRKNRINSIFFGINFILNFIINFFFLFFKSRNLFTIYLYTLIKKINPKVVITSVDNSFKFSELSKLFKNKINFIAIQNANRFDYALNYYFYKKKLIKKNLNLNYNIPYFFCFGEHEIAEAKKYNLKVDNFYKVGSIRLSNFLEYIKINKIELTKDKYDLCLISEPWHRDSLIKNTDFIGTDKDFIKIVKYTIKYAKKNNLKFIFLERFKNIGIWKDMLSSELEFYKKNLDETEYNFLIHNKLNKEDDYASYFGLLQSKVAIASQSTLLRDKLGFQEKILSMALPRAEIFDFPINGICKLKNYNYSKFENRLDKLLKMTIDEYLDQLDKPTSYIMEFNKETNAVQKSVEKIDLILKSNSC